MDSVVQMKKIIFLLMCVYGLQLKVSGQETKFITRIQILNGDTLPLLQLKEVEVLSLSIPKSKSERKKLTKLVKNVKRVYPFAKLAGIQLRKYEDILLATNTPQERKKIMKMAEQEIQNKYGDELKQLTFTQGKILIKLLDRETGNSSFELVQELRGKFTAFFYQAFARLWGYDLKIKYDPEGADKQIETIVRMIERGQI